MSTVFRIKRGSTQPQLSITLTNASGTPIDLTDCENVRLCAARNFETDTAELTIDKALTVVDAEDGEVVADWIEGDTDVTPQTYKAEVNFDDADGKPVKIGVEFYIVVEPPVESVS